MKNEEKRKRIVMGHGSTIRIFHSFIDYLYSSKNKQDRQNQSYEIRQFSSINDYPKHVRSFVDIFFPSHRTCDNFASSNRLREFSFCFFLSRSRIIEHSFLKDNKEKKKILIRYIADKGTYKKSEEEEKKETKKKEIE